MKKNYFQKNSLRRDGFTVFKFNVPLEPHDLSGWFSISYEALEHNLLAFFKRNLGSGIVHNLDAVWWNLIGKNKKI